jgi:hypothetical protein
VANAVVDMGLKGTDRGLGKNDNNYFDVGNGYSDMGSGVVDNNNEAMKMDLLMTNKDRKGLGSDSVVF